MPPKQIRGRNFDWVAFERTRERAEHRRRRMQDRVDAHVAELRNMDWVASHDYLDRLYRHSNAQLSGIACQLVN